MDQIFFNGTIRTLDPAIPLCQALAVKDGVIMRMGTDGEILSLAGPETAKIDLKGRLVLPGFCDSHMHLLHYAQVKNCLSLFHATSLSEIMELCAGAVAAAKEKGSWIMGLGFNENNWDDKTLPTRRDLDRVSQDVPIVIRRACFHMMIVNTKALELLGLTGEKQETTTHRIGFYPDGTPNGFLQEETQNLVQLSMGTPPLEQIKELILSAACDAAAMGIVQIHSDDFEAFAGNQAELIIQAYRELAEEGKLPIRIYQQCLLRDQATLDAFLDHGHRTGESYGAGLFRGAYTLGPLKILTDGSLGANTAVLRKPYCNAPNTKGIHIYEKAVLQKLFDTAHRNGMQIAVHCIGDGAIEQTLDCLETAMDICPRANPRHGVVHCQITDIPLLERFRSLNVMAYIQPIFVRGDMDIVDDCVGPELAATSYNWRKMEDLGIHASGGSDCPVEPFDILPNICCAVTRTDLAGSAPWYPENGVTVEEAVKMFTIEGAYASFEEDIRGSLTVGKLADLVVLDRNIFQIPADEIKDVSVDMTVVNGRIVYERTQAKTFSI